MIFKHLFLNYRFFYGIIFLSALYILSFFSPNLLNITHLILALFILLLIFDLILLASKKQGIEGERILAPKLSNFSENKVDIIIKSKYAFPVFVEILEELPYQIKIRELKLHTKLNSNQTKELSYEFLPFERGEYEFGNMNCFVRTFLNFFSKKQIIEDKQVTKVYPNYLNLNKYDLKYLTTIDDFGIKKIRRIGHSMEFEQIKEYVKGDDIRTLNWNATAKTYNRTGTGGNFMVNQYTEEKAQQVYGVIDTGRNMKMPFKGLSLLDYSINSILILLKTVLNNQDKAGLFSFNKNIENLLMADKRNTQMNKILNALYNVKPLFLESDFAMLYNNIRRKITHRSLIFLFTNFENWDSFERQLKYLKVINKQHLLVLIFFQNTELEDFENLVSTNKGDYYQKVVIEKQLYEKRLIIRELKKHGIQVIYTKPEDLTINSINKYLEIKAKTMI